MTFTKTLAVGTILATALAAGSALAKGHDQGAGPNGMPPTAPGVQVGEETVFAAHTLGERRSAARRSGMAAENSMRPEDIGPEGGMENVAVMNAGRDTE